MRTFRPTDTVETAVAEIAAGRPVVLIGEMDRADGHLVFAAELATPAVMAFLVRHCSGFVCVALPEPDCRRLRLPPMHYADERTAATFRVAVDAAAGIGTGISATDRARTARLLADASSSSTDFTRPGHVVPVAAQPVGVGEHCVTADGAVELARAAGLRPAGVFCGIVSTIRPTEMARGAEVPGFATAHRLAAVHLSELAAYNRSRRPGAAFSGEVA